MYYLALIGDITNSRHYQNRGDIQRALAAAIKQLNKQYKKHLRSPFTITLGDEFQALLSDARPLWPAIIAIEQQFFPIQFRFGIGVGEISTDINPKEAIGMDGPAFHHARAAIEHIKANKRASGYKIIGTDNDYLADRILWMIAKEKEKWKPNRLTIFQQYLAEEEVKNIANELGLSKVAVYKNIDEGNLEPIRDILNNLAQTITQTIAQHDAD